MQVKEILNTLSVDCQFKRENRQKHSLIPPIANCEPFRTMLLHRSPLSSVRQQLELNRGMATKNIVS